MFNYSNILSISRAGFALIFLKESAYARLIALTCAMISDFLDGYLARRVFSPTKLGAILDPLMDKLFIAFVGGVLYKEGALSACSLLALLSRDFFLFLFCCYLLFNKAWRGYDCRAMMVGKLTTFLQFTALVLMIIGCSFPSFIFSFFFLLGVGSFIERLARCSSSQICIKQK
ncbi:CDP-diacylglycerol--glycerol-3-phosphate 3-phosphatidyltransferase [Candidatus Clavichlamydia salmonicola]|uniref:CDP-alcohol phosphatidyltransferase family protein n=1 Tax=Candidatus Clavichlamydia salmonicola TaxID=469812 RepID=UPI001891B191|nr:CDP-alcohol phosphatidyltransferase family protein [Candidatus Clavichlamydia salmonicola]MBF5050981.1 CDP-diacylglycerol--glycerol-3-phosphate 3-phosphatidyltransferase [Candidatus Clavichlamydia salmonicola]